MKRKDRQGFSSDVDLRFPIGGRNPYLGDDFVYVDNEGGKHVAPKNMTTDGASIPRVFWRIVGHPFESSYLPAAIIHDSYCRDADDVFNAGCLDEAKKLRQSADDLFLEMLLCLKIPKFKARLMYWAVRLDAKTRF